MNKIIISILKTFSLGNTLDPLLAEEQISLINAGCTDEAEQVLFEKEPLALIVDWEVPGIAEFINTLKADEMFQNLPVLAVANRDLTSEVFASGADSCVCGDNAKELLLMYLKPLVRLSLSNHNLTQRISELQERGIRDFILLDLIKKYIPRTIMDIAEEYAVQQKLEIPKKEMDLTIVLADIKDFTRMSQHLKPVEVIDNLNAVFAIVTKITYEEDGDIDKFIGDAFLAVFNEPFKAIKAMVRIQSEVEQLNIERKNQNLAPIEFRIGINSGPIIRGNVGGNNRYDNTLIGDTVNTASRLQDIAPPGGIMISETTREKSGLNIPGEYKNLVNMKGREGDELVWNVFEYLKETGFSSGKE
jgi:class 3 adenylate cyclase